MTLLGKTTLTSTFWVGSRLGTLKPSVRSVVSVNRPITLLPPYNKPSSTADTERGPAVSCHPLFLALFAEIVLNTRKVEGGDPPQELFAGIPTAQVASELTNRFLSSLHNRAMELWVTELSPTPRFDEQAALTLDTERHHHNGRAGWEQLVRFSFVERLPDGFYCLHKTMRDALRARIQSETAQELHKWFANYWTGREEQTIAWYHQWVLDPAGALEEWVALHKAALKGRRISKVRALLTGWSGIGLDDADRRMMGGALSARTHRRLGVTLWETPVAPLAPALTDAIEHFESALRVYT